MSAISRASAVRRMFGKERLWAFAGRSQHAKAGRRLRIEQLELRQLLSMGATINILDSSRLADDAKIQFMTPLSQFRTGAVDSVLVRPSYPDTRQYLDVTNSGSVPLTLFELKVNAPDVSVDVPLTAAAGDDILLHPNQTQRFHLSYAPTLPNSGSLTTQCFALADGLVILSSAVAQPQFLIELRGVSTFNSDLNYDGQVNLDDLGALNANFGRRAGDPNWDPTAEINGDGAINLGDLGALNLEAWLDGIGAIIVAGLAHDTAPGGVTNEDRITSDPTFSGRVTDPDGIASLRVGFDDTAVGSFADVTGDVQPDGSFLFSRARLAELNGAPLMDGLHTLHLLAADSRGNITHQSATFTLHTQPPAVTGKVPADLPLASTVTTIDVFFSEAVYGVSSADLVLAGAGATDAVVGTPTNVGGNLWRFPARELRDGEIEVVLASGAGDIEDLAGNALPTETWHFAVDLTSPQITNTLPKDEGINTSAVDVLVSFSEAVQEIDASDLELTDEGAALASVGQPTLAGGNTWRFPVTALAEGDVSATLAADVGDIEDLVGNALLPMTWHFAVDFTPPVVNAKTPQSQAINTSAIDVLVTFSEPIEGVNASDLVLSGTGAATAIVGDPTAAGENAWRFPVTGLKNGQVTAALASTAGAITDLAGNSLPPTTWTFTIDLSAPTVTAKSPSGTTLTARSTNIDATFSEAVTGLDILDLMLSGAGVAEAVVQTPSLVSGNKWRFSVSKLITGPVNVSLAPDAGDITDLAGNSLAPMNWSFSVNLSTITAASLETKGLGFQINGIAPNDLTGVQVSGAGDVNADGIADLLVSAPFADPHGESSSQIYVVFGPTNTKQSINLSTLVAQGRGIQINGVSENDFGGRGLGAGDVNGDGLSDIIIGVPYANVNGLADAGITYVVFGSVVPHIVELSTLIANHAGIQINGYQAQAVSGYDVGCAGDVNGDGLDDVIIGAPNGAPDGTPYAGESYVVFGTAASQKIELSSLVADSKGISIRGAAAGDCSGVSVSGAGDVNGDGLGDVVIGAGYADPNQVDSAGAAFVVFGSRGSQSISLSTLVVDGKGLQMSGANSKDFSGIDVSGAGDVNGDGLWDMVIASFYVDPGGQEKGCVFVVYGSAASQAISLSTLVADGRGFRVDNIDVGAATHGTHDYNDLRVAGAGDVNGDGLGDIITGSRYASSPFVLGLSYLVFGTSIPATIDSTVLVGQGKGITIKGSWMSDFLGASVDVAGDVNGDGVGDVILGAPGVDAAGSNAGAGYVLFGIRDHSITQAGYIIRTLQGNAPPRPVGITGSFSNAATPDSHVWVDFNDPADASGPATTQVVRYDSVAAAGVQGLDPQAVLDHVWHITTSRTAMLGTTVMFSYPGTQVGDLIEADLRLLYSADGQTWQSLPTDVSEISRNRLRTTVDQFGYFAIDRSLAAWRPRTTLVDSGGAVTSSTDTHTFVVRHEARQGTIALGTLDDQDIQVLGPNGFSQYAQLLAVDSTAGDAVVEATYQISAPNGRWSATDNGTYSISVCAEQIWGSNGLAVREDSLGTFSVALTLTATLLNNGGAVTEIGETIHEFVIRFASGAGSVALATLDGQDIVVTGPNDFSQTAQLVGASAAVDSQVLDAVYRMAVPNGSWRLGDSGMYAFELQANQVSDTLGAVAPAGVLGHFLVDLPVLFADPDLESAVKETLQLTAAAVVRTTDMASLTSLSTDGNEIHSLGGLEWAVNLHDLRLWPADWSPTPQCISDLEPLAGLANLEQLTLARVGISDAMLSTLEAFPSLRSLDLRYNHIVDVTPLRSLQWLTSLYLYGNPLSDTAALAGMNLRLDLVKTGADNASTIPELAAALGYLPLNLFQYVYNHVEYQPYAGLMKGPQAAWETRAGNAWDTAALLLELLQESGVTARFVTGRVLADQTTLSQWIGVTDLGSAYALLRTAGLNPRGFDSPLTKLWFDHTWVEAWLPASDGTLAWVALDPSCKFKDYRDGVSNILDLAPFAEDEYLSQVRTNLPYEYYEDQVAQYLSANQPRVGLADVPHDGPIIQQIFAAFPTTQSYASRDAVSRFDSLADVPLTWKHTADVVLKQNDAVLLQHQFVLPEMCLQRVTVGYVPIPAHQSIVDGYGGLASTPAGAVDVIPQLKVEGTVIAAGTAVAYRSDLLIELQRWQANAAEPDVQAYPRKAGQYIAVGYNALQVSETMLARRVQAVNRASIAAADGQPYDVDDLIGGLLSLAIAKYYHDAQQARDVVDGLAQFARAQWAVEAGLATSELELIHVEDLLYPLVPKQTLIDVAGAVLASGAFVHGQEDQATYDRLLRQDILNGSALEHGIWQELINCETISTVKSLQLAHERGVPVFQIDSSNINTYLPQLTLPGQTVASIQTEVNAGSTVTTPRDPTPLNDWNGVGYLVVNSGYLGAIISGQFDSSHALLEAHGGYVTDWPLPDLFDWPQYPTGEHTYEPDWWLDSSFYDLGAALDEMDWFGLPDDHQSLAGDPVNVANGNVVRDEADFSLPGIGLALGFQRHYDSQVPVDTGLGRGWVYSFGDYLASNPDRTAVVWNTAAGYRYVFTADGAGGFISPPTIHGALTATADGFAFRNKDGMVHGFDGSGRLTEIRDRNGNSLVMTYDGASHLTQVTDADVPSRRLTFTWTGAHITAVSDFTGRTWMYRYSGSDLVEVTSAADAATPAISVQYDYYTGPTLGGLLKQIHESNGATTSYTYYPNRWAFEVTNANGSTHRFYYDRYRNQTTFVDERGAATTYVYNDKGNVLEVIHPDRGRDSYDWSDVGMLSWTDALGNSESYAYDGQGNVVRLTDRSGLTTEYSYEPAFNNVLAITRPGQRITNFAYDDRGNPTSVTDALGFVITMSYDSRGLLLTQTGSRGNLTPDPADYTTTFTYNDAGQRLSQTTDLPSTVSYTYDARGDRLSVTDANQNTTHYDYDLLGRVLEIRDPLEHARTFTYDGAGNVLTEMDALGSVIERGYDLMQNLVQTTYADGAVVTYGYDSVGNLQWQTDELGRAVHQTYDSRGRRTVTKYPDGAQTQNRWDADGRLASTIDALGHETCFTYDAAGRLLTTTDALGQTSARSYDLVGNLQTETDRRGAVTTYTNDLLDRLTQVRGEGGFVLTVDYDANGNRTQAVRYDVSGLATVPDDPRVLSAERKQINQAVYDVLGRAIQQIDPLGHSTSTEYDAGGRVVRTTDPRDQETQYRYDAAGNLVQRTNPDSGTVLYAYDEVYRRIGLTMPEGGIWQWTYDRRGRTVAETDPLGRQTKFGYDAVDAVLGQTNPDGSWLKNGYDARGRLVRRDRSDGSFDKFSYDLNGNVTRSENDRSRVTLTYDALNRRLSEATTIVGDSFAPSITYQYDAEGHLDTLTDRWTGTTSRTIDYAFDLADRLSGLADTLDSLTTSLTYTGFGQRDTITYGNGRADRFTYDGVGQLAEIAFNGPGTASSIGYVRDEAGNPLTVSETLGGVSETLTVTYDSMGRPTLVAAAVAAARGESFSYDQDGNLIDIGPVTGGTFNGADQLASSSAGSYAYDAQGNLAVTANADGSRTETRHDASNRILGIKQYNGSSAIRSRSWPAQVVC